MRTDVYVALIVNPNKVKDAMRSACEQNTDRQLE